MNYSRNIKKTSIGKRVLISWVVVAIIFSLIGFGIGVICSRGGSSNEQNEYYRDATHHSQNALQKERLV